MKPKRVRFEMKYIGWNIGSVRIEREESKAGIEILEMSIDGVDILKMLDSSLFKENVQPCSEEATKNGTNQG